MSVKTLAIRLDSELHARISILARLAELSVTDAIRVAIENHVEVMAADPAVAAKAVSLREQIAREAADQQSALQALFGAESSGSAAPAAPPAKATRAANR